MVTQVGISMMTPMFLAGLLGYYLNKKCSVDFWFVIFLLLGIGAGFRNVYLLLKPFYENDSKKEYKQIKNDDSKNSGSDSNHE